MSEENPFVDLKSIEDYVWSGTNIWAFLPIEGQADRWREAGREDLANYAELAEELGASGFQLKDGKVEMFFAVEGVDGPSFLRDDLTDEELEKWVEERKKEVVEARSKEPK